MKKTEEKLTTKNGIPLRKEDIQKAFSVLKSILLSKGVYIKTSLTNTNTKDGSIVKIFELLEEYAKRRLEEPKNSEEAIDVLIDFAELVVSDTEAFRKMKKTLLVLLSITIAGWGAFLFLYFRG